MKTMSLVDYRDFCAENNTNTYIFVSQNQSARRFLEPIQYNLVFSEQRIDLPGVITLKDSSKNYIQFERVKYVVAVDHTVIGDVFKVVCERSNENCREKSFTIVVR